MPAQVECPESEQAALEEDALVEPEEHQPHPNSDATCAHVAQLDEKALHGSEGGVTAQVLLLGHTQVVVGEHATDAVALDCWHAAMEDEDEVLPAEQYSKRAHM